MGRFTQVKEEPQPKARAGDTEQIAPSARSLRERQNQSRQIAASIFHTHRLRF